MARKPRMLLDANPVNPDPRTNVVLTIDTSGSMGQPIEIASEREGSPMKVPIDEVNKALPEFKEQCERHHLVRRHLEIALVTSACDVMVGSFQSIVTWKPPRLTATTGTALGMGLNTGLDLIESRREQLKKLGVPLQHSVQVLISDGGATDAPSYSKRAAERIRELEKGEDFDFFAIGIHPQDQIRLSALQTKHPPVLLEGLRFDLLFQWLLGSVMSIAASTEDEAVRLSPMDLHGSLLSDRKNDPA